MRTDFRNVLRWLARPGACHHRNPEDEVQLKAGVTLAVLSLLAVSCGYSIKTSTDYDRTVNFSSYNSFFMMKGNSSGNPLLDQRVADDVRAALTSKGWAEVPEGEGRAA